MGKFLLVFLFFSFLLLSSVLFADQNIARITLTSPKILQTEPGRIISASFLVANDNLFESQYYEEVVLPDGWQAITPSQKTPFSLGPKEQQLRLVSFLIPQASPADTYQVSYYVRSRRDERNFVKEDFSVAVSPFSKIEIFVEDKPDLVIAGDIYKVKLRLINRGNAEIKLKIDAQSMPDNPLKIDQKEFMLDPNGSQIFTIQVQTDKKLTRSVDNIIKVKAQTEDLKYQVEQAIAVKIISTITGVLDPYFRLPSRFRLIGLSEKYTGQKHTYRFQEELSGSGNLDEEGQRSLEYLFRGPDLQKIGPYGQPDEYFIKYNDRFMNFIVGDTSYSLSPMTDQYKYGRGAGLDIHPGKQLGFGGFYVKERWNDNKEKHQGNYLSYVFNDAFTLRGNFLDKTQDNTGYNDKIYTLQALINPKEILNLNLEYARDENNRGGSKSKDYGYYANIHGAYKDRFNYILEVIHAEPNYYGYYNDIDSKSLTANFPVFKNLKGNFYYRNYRDNLDMDPVKGIANREEYFKGGLYYPFKAMTFSLDAEDYQRKDKLLPADYNFREKVLTFGFGWSNILRIFNFQGFIEEGENRNKLKDIEKNILRKRFYLTVTPLESLSFNFYATMGNNRFTDDTRKSRDLGAGAVWRVLKSLFVSVNFDRLDFASPDFEPSNRITTRANYILPNKHEIAFAGTYLKYKDSKKEEISLYWTYTIPWDIPIRRKKNIGILKGRVFDVEKEGKPIAGAILTVENATAVTNRNGEFVFPALSPGTRSLWVNKPSIGLQRVTTKKFPVMVEIKGGQVARADIGVVTASRIFGRLIAFDSRYKPVTGEQVGPTEFQKTGISEQKESEFVEKGGLGNVLIEINDGEDVIQQRTDSKGMFSFEGLRPCKWTLIVNIQDLPPDYSVDKRMFEIEVKPGEEKEVIIKALPRLRRIQIIEKEELKLEKRPGKNKFLENLLNFLKNK